jgi:hypothetical protein
VTSCLGLNNFTRVFVLIFVFVFHFRSVFLSRQVSAVPRQRQDLLRARSQVRCLPFVPPRAEIFLSADGHARLTRCSGS